MNHYEKLAIVIFRALGCSSLIYGLFGVTSTIAGRLISYYYEAAYAAVYFYTYSGYGLAGLAMFVFSKPLARLIAGRL